MRDVFVYSLQSTLASMVTTPECKQLGVRIARGGRYLPFHAPAFELLDEVEQDIVTCECFFDRLSRFPGFLVLGQPF